MTNSYNLNILTCALKYYFCNLDKQVSSPELTQNNQTNPLTKTKENKENQKSLREKENKEEL